MKPLISVKIPTYNCAEYLIQTIESILNQKDFDLELLEIEVIDDCSTLDNPEDIVIKYGQGKVGFYRQPQNVGAVKNFNTCIERSDGEFVHILHGDDFIAPEFYASAQEKLESNPSILITRAHIIDENSREIGISDSLDFSVQKNLYYYNLIKTPGVIMNKKTLNSIGFFDENLVHVADWDMWLRLIKQGNFCIINKPLCSYREFGGNDTSRLMKTAENIKDIIRLGKKLEINDDFDKRSFYENCRTIAYHQFLKFQSIGDSNSAEMNYDVLRILNIKLYGRLMNWIFPKYKL